MQLFNLVPTNADAGRAMPKPGGREAPPEVRFDQTLEQSQRQHKRTSSHSDDGRQVDRHEVARRDTAGANGDRRATRETDDAKQSADRERSTRAEGREVMRGRDDEPTTSERQALSDVDGVKREIGDEPSDMDEALAELRATLRALMNQNETDDDVMMDDASLEALDALVAALMETSSKDELKALLSKGSGAGDELARMMRQLTMQGEKSSQTVDPLAALMTMPLTSGKSTGQSARPSVFESSEASHALASGDGEASNGKVVKLGQMVGQAMPALAAMLQGTGKQGAGSAGDMQALFAQLVNAASAGKSGQGGGELLTTLMQAGPQSGSLNGQALNAQLGTAAPGQGAADDVDAQTNASRLTRAMHSAVNQGGGTLTLRMTPPEMGTVRIQLSVQAGTVNAALHAENESARTLLSQQLSQLRQSLESQGLHVERLSVQSMTGSNSTNSAQQGQADGSPDDGRSRDEYRGSGQQQGGQRDGDAQQQSASGGFEQALEEVDMVSPTD
ncbi:flagellar hook-length control protein FliK [Phycisphaerales bacterium AB-hyl4]|uniref:Flagellar hook-length control protein FliK n=1 Tax=Natronomicrosphaera hydrolytica TaxID=3242702 RepID=A0ABV4U4X7_9BACT